MDYKTIWNDLCFRIKEKNKSDSEDIVQIIIECFFERLGWSISEGEIIIKKQFKDTQEYTNQILL